MNGIVEEKATQEKGTMYPTNKALIQINHLDHNQNNCEAFTYDGFEDMDQEEVPLCQPPNVSSPAHPSPE